MLLQVLSARRIWPHASWSGCMFCNFPADHCSYFSVVMPVNQCFRHVTLSCPIITKIKKSHRQLSIELISATHWFFHSLPHVLVCSIPLIHKFSPSFMPFWRMWPLILLWAWRIWSKQLKWALPGSSVPLDYFLHCPVSGTSLLGFKFSSLLLWFIASHRGDVLCLGRMTTLHQGSL